jgi:CheY-like chemotaxis protein
LARPGSDGHAALGLALTLARGLARRLGLPFDVRSVEGRGAVFTVVLPRVAENRGGTLEEDGKAADGMEGGSRNRVGSGRTRSIEDAEEDERDIGGARVLVIEDDPMVLAALNALLGQWGCTVLDAESYEGVLDRLGPPPWPPIDLIISDLRLKGAANGIVAIRRLTKAFDRTVPGMILTGDTDPKRLREARLSGYLLLHKPVAPLALRAAVVRLLSRENAIS